MVRVHEGPPPQDHQGFSQSQAPQDASARGALTPETLKEAIEAFLVSRQVGGCTSRTVNFYREVLAPFQKTMEANQSDCTPLAVQKYLTGLRSRVNGTTTHLHFSKLRAFFGWCVEAGLLQEHRNVGSFHFEQHGGATLFHIFE